jgi:hypothetical protein
MLQAFLGRIDSHQFERDGKYWGAPDVDEIEGAIEGIDDSRVPVRSVLLAANPVHAEGFDLKAVNDVLGRMLWPVRPRR